MSSNKTELSEKSTFENSGWDSVFVVSCCCIGVLLGWHAHRYRRLFSRITYDYKLTLVVPADVQTWNRTTIVQHCGSASILACQNSAKNNRLEAFLWTLTGQRKIVVKAGTDFESICQQAHVHQVCSSLVKDKGRNAVLALGPAPAKILDKITGSFRLY